MLAVFGKGARDSKDAKENEMFRECTSLKHTALSSCPSVGTHEKKANLT